MLNKPVHAFKITHNKKCNRTVRSIRNQFQYKRLYDTVTATVTGKIALVLAIKL